MEPDKTIKDINESEDLKNKKDFVKIVTDITFKDILNDPKSSQRFQEDINDCLLYIDFNKIHKAMKSLNWIWFRWVDQYGCEHQNETPCVYAIKNAAMDMFRNFKKDVMNDDIFKDHYSSSCGGWTLDCNIYDNEMKIYFNLIFSLEEFSNSY